MAGGVSVWTDLGEAAVTACVKDLWEQLLE